MQPGTLAVAADTAAILREFLADPGTPRGVRSLAENAGLSGASVLVITRNLARAGWITPASATTYVMPPAGAAAARHQVTGMAAEFKRINDSRAGGASWQVIADRLSYPSKQAAQQRHKALASSLRMLAGVMPPGVAVQLPDVITGPDTPVRLLGEEKTLSQWAADPRCLAGEDVLRARLASGESLEALISRGASQGERRQDLNDGSPPKIGVSAATVLRLFLAEPNTPRGLLDIAQEAGLRTGSALRIMGILERAGWITEGITASPGEEGTPRSLYRMPSTGYASVRRQLAAMAAEASLVSSSLAAEASWDLIAGRFGYAGAAAAKARYERLAEVLGILENPPG